MARFRAGQPFHFVQDIQLNFNQTAVLGVNVILAVLIFGVSLSIRIADFKRLLSLPRAPLAGALAQFGVMPALTFLLTYVLETPAGLALGLLVVAACPGGNLSNIMTHLARGSTALSIGMTSISTALALFFTPLNIGFWGALRPETAELIAAVALSPLRLFEVIGLVLLLPLLAGMWTATTYPEFARRMQRPVRIFAFAFFLAAVAGAFAANWKQFLEYAGIVFVIIAIQNAVAYAGGYATARILSLREADARAVAIETGIQNAGLAIIIIFTFFDGRGDMLLVGAGVGVYQIASGTLLAFFWSRRDPVSE